MSPSPPSLSPSFFQSSWEILATRMSDIIDSLITAAVDSRKERLIVVGEKLSEPACGVFDIPTQTWERLPARPSDRLKCASICYEGKIYVLGGSIIQHQTGTGQIQRSVEHINIENAEEGWRESPPMLVPRANFAAVLVDDKIIAIGGFSEGIMSSLQSVEQFDLENGAWAPLPSMLQARMGCSAAAVNRKLYVFGGQGLTGLLKSAEYFDTMNQTWEALPDMPSVRVGGIAVAVGHYILLMGGYDETVSLTDRVDCFDTVNLGWVTGRALPSLNKRRFACGAVLVGNQVFMIGGAHPTMEVIEINPFFITVPRFSLLLEQEEDLPLGLWPHIISGSTPSIIYFVLSANRFKVDSVLSCS